MAYVEIGKKGGRSNSRLYNIWLHIKARCYKHSDEHFHWYGGRGITMCEEWKNDFKAFYDWAMSHGYSDELTIDRIDNDGNYEPSNCRWVTRKEQSNNRRSNIPITIEDVTHNIQEWSELTGIKYHTIYYRIKNGKTGLDILKGGDLTWLVKRTLKTK